MNCKTFALIGIILVGVALHNAVGQSFEAPQDVDKAEEVRPVVYSRTSRGIGKLFKNLFRGKKGEEKSKNVVSASTTNNSNNVPPPLYHSELMYGQAEGMPSVYSYMNNGGAGYPPGYNYNYGGSSANPMAAYGRGPQDQSSIGALQHMHQQPEHYYGNGNDAHYDQAQGIAQGQELAYAPNQEQGYVQGQGQGYAQDQGLGYSQGQGQAYPQGQGPAYSQEQGQAYPQGQGQAHPQGQGQAYPQGQGQTYPQGQGQAYPQGQGQAYPQGQGQAYNQGQGQAYPQGQSQSYSQGQGQAYPQVSNQAYPQGQGQAYPHGQGQVYPQGQGQAYGQGQDQTYAQGQDQAYAQGQDQSYGQQPNQANVPMQNGPGLAQSQSQQPQFDTEVSLGGNPGYRQGPEVYSNFQAPRDFVHGQESKNRPAQVYTNNNYGQQHHSMPQDLNVAQSNTYTSLPYGPAPGQLDVNKVLDNFLLSNGLSPDGHHDMVKTGGNYYGDLSQVLSIKKLYSMPFHVSSSGEQQQQQQQQQYGNQYASRRGSGIFRKAKSLPIMSMLGGLFPTRKPGYQYEGKEFIIVDQRNATSTTPAPSKLQL